MSRFSTDSAVNQAWGSFHHQQRPSVRRRWLRDRLRSRLSKGRAGDGVATFHLSDNTPAGAHRHRDRCAKPSSRLEGNAESEMPILRRGARNLGARDVYQWCATGCYRPVTPVVTFGLVAHFHYVLSPRSPSSTHD